MDMEIKSYIVGTNRQKNQPNHHRRWIELIPKNPTAEFQHIVIYFFVQELGNDPDVGYQTPNSTHFVVGYANPTDFQDMYHILQSERPVKFFWWADDSDSLYGYQIYTGNEPTGEGPRDLPPIFRPPLSL